MSGADIRRASIRRADRDANRGYPKSRMIMSMFRSAQRWRGRRGPAKLVYAVVAGFYKVASEWILGVEIPVGTVVGPGLRLRHGVGLVVNPGARIGADVMLRHGVTIGNRGDSDASPTIGDHVEIGAGATLVGDIRIGDHARIGPGVLVTEDVPAWSVVMPARASIRPRRDAPAAYRYDIARRLHPNGGEQRRSPGAHARATPEIVEGDLPLE